ncbi:MAG TPA: DUF1552 domain-containing protein, partial [Polyangiaceae bacterium]|nr:DUF1552 domain-containing protein [Polyangiaceae bacterium]
MRRLHRPLVGSAISRRHVLTGAGVALTLPWLESLAPRRAEAQSAKAPLRFLPIYLPNGAPEFWTPTDTGSGSAWQISSVLSPLATHKSRLIVLSGLENGSVFNADGSAIVEPPHSRQAGAWLTCQDAVALRQQLNVADANGISADQLMAADAAVTGAAPLPSLQVGLSTTQSSCDGQPCSLSRSVSWKSQTEPLYKLINPTQAFDTLVGAIPGPSAIDAANVAKARREAQKSVLDAVLESAQVIQPKLSQRDVQRMDEFLQSVREVEKKIDTNLPGLANCAGKPPPNFIAVGPGTEFRNNSGPYNKGIHADLMRDVIVLAFQCQLTHIVSYMLEDENSEFVYDNVRVDKFSADGALTTGVCGSYAGAQHGDQNEYASITRWNVQKVADLCDALARTPDSDGRTLLDNTVVFLGG